MVTLYVGSHSRIRRRGRASLWTRAHDLDRAVGHELRDRVALGVLG